MACSDFVADFLTIVRNATRAGKDKVAAPASNMTVSIAEILKAEGFVENVKTYEEGVKRFVRIHLKKIEEGKRSAIQGIVRISTPGRRVYVGHDEIPKIQGGLGVAIVSTSKGVFTDRQAREQKVGGELLCKVW